MSSIRKLVFAERLGFFSLRKSASKKICIFFAQLWNRISRNLLISALSVYPESVAPNDCFKIITVILQINCNLESRLQARTQLKQSPKYFLTSLTQKGVFLRCLARRHSKKVVITGPLRLLCADNVRTGF